MVLTKRLRVQTSEEAVRKGKTKQSKARKWRTFCFTAIMALGFLVLATTAAIH